MTRRDDLVQANGVASLVNKNNGKGLTGERPKLRLIDFDSRYRVCTIWQSKAKQSSADSINVNKRTIPPANGGRWNNCPAI